MEEQRLAACAEKLKRLDEKHRQTSENKSSAPQDAVDDLEVAHETTSVSAPTPAISPVPLALISQSQPPVLQASHPERLDRDRERLEREHERVEPCVEDEVNLPRQPSPPIQRPVARSPDTQSEGEISLAEVVPLMEQNQTDRTTVPIQDYFNMEDDRGKLM